uniref:DUF1618 domain-containing protein n=1 Tax=Setaria viridis TaxID=4556 RepID=A0A4U6UYU8_SETVI|nr:hypothetical protein SEVIR_4G023300v2 [Setaria viridis]
MKLPTKQLPLGGFVDGLNGVFRYQRSIGIRRSIYLAPDRGGRPTEPSDSPAPAKDPRWTVAECRTSTGRSLCVSSAGLSAPPASSFLYYNCTGTAPDGKDGDAPKIIAAHGDSILLRMMRPREASSSFMATFDHFVYRAGAAAAARPPSLSLLPPRNIPTRHEEAHEEGGALRDRYNRVLLPEDTGVLRRGGDELLVMQIELMPEYSERHGTADLCVLQLGSSVWEQKRSVPIVHEEGDELPGPLSAPDMAIPVGDRFLCCVCYEGFILCDMAEEASPKLRYIRLPSSPYDPDYYTDGLLPLPNPRSMGAAGDGAVRFVAIEPRCCCGGLGRSSCPRSRFAFTVTTWTMTLTMDKPVTWVKDGVMDCEELWALPGYDGIPRVHLQEPLVSLDNPDVVCFKVVSNADWKEWMIQVDTRRKALLAAVQCSTKRNKHLAARLQ